VPVIVATSDPASPATASRHCVGTCALPVDASADAIVEAFLSAGKKLAEIGHERIPLFCGEDHHLRIIQDFREPLSRWFRMALNDPQVARALLDKSLFQALAEDRHLPVPGMISWEALGDHPGPVLVKPKSKAQEGFRAAAQAFFPRDSKARVFASGPSLQNDPIVRRIADTLVFQEYVPGDDRSIWSFHGFADEQGELLEWFIGRKIRTFPPLTGESSYIELANDEELAALGKEVAARIPLKGIFKIDFKRSEVTGKFYLLEVNARCNLWLYLGARNGVNLARAAYDYLVSGSRPSHAVPTGKFRWLCLRLDYRAYRRLSAQGQITGIEWVRSLVESRKVYSLFSWTDPAPFVRHQLNRGLSLRRQLRA